MDKVALRGVEEIGTGLEICFRIVAWSRVLVKSKVLRRTGEIDTKALP